MLNKKDAENMAKAIRFWMDYQILCKRDMLLSEAYLTQSVGEFLLSCYPTSKLEVEYNHPNLNRGKRGRPRQIDFVLRSRDAKRITTAIEVKWIGNMNADKKRLLDDLLRLECIRGNQGITRYFLLAGKKDKIDTNCFNLEINAGKKRIRFFEQILLQEINRPHSVKVERCEDAMRSLYASFQDDYKIELPKSFKTTLVANEEGEGVHVLIWEVRSTSKRTTFSPADSWTNVTAQDTDSDD